MFRPSLQWIQLSRQGEYMRASWVCLYVRVNGQVKLLRGETHGHMLSTDNFVVALDKLSLSPTRIRWLIESGCLYWIGLELILLQLSLSYGFSMCCN
jgi:hypothetical protein